MGLRLRHRGESVEDVIQLGGNGCSGVIEGPPRGRVVGVNVLERVSRRAHVEISQRLDNKGSLWRRNLDVKRRKRSTGRGLLG